jgi:hypothetical protein
LNSAPLTAVRDWMIRFDALWDKHLKKLKRQVEASR